MLAPVPRHCHGLQKGLCHCCRSSWWRFVGLNPWAYVSRERPARRWILLIIVMTLFCSLPEQHQDWRRQLMLLRKWACWRPRSPADPTPFCVFDAGGLGLSKTPSLPKSEDKNCLKIPLPIPWSWVVDGKKCLGVAHKIRYRDQVGTPSQNICLEQSVYQIKCDILSFKNMVQLLKSFNQKWSYDLPGAALDFNHYTSVLRSSRKITYIYVSNTNPVKDVLHYLLSNISGVFQIHR